jgi:hypothetical protein
MISQSLGVGRCPCNHMVFWCSLVMYVCHEGSTVRASPILCDLLSLHGWMSAFGRPWDQALGPLTWSCRTLWAWIMTIHTQDGRAVWYTLSHIHTQASPHLMDSLCSSLAASIEYGQSVFFMDMHMYLLLVSTVYVLGPGQRVTDPNVAQPNMPVTEQAEYQITNWPNRASLGANGGIEKLMQNRPWWLM